MAFTNSKIKTLSVDKNNKYFSSKGCVMFNKNKTELLFCTAAINGKYRVPDSVVKIHEEAFRSYIDLTEVTIPKKTKRIEKNAFLVCESLTKVNLSDGLEYIGYSCFAYCPISEITVPSSTKIIDEMAFMGCNNLKKVKLSEGLEEIGPEVFALTSIKEITIPSSVKTVCVGAFFSCKDLRKVTIMSSSTKFEPSVFDLCCNIREVYIPQDAHISDYTYFSGLPEDNSIFIRMK